VGPDLLRADLAELYPQFGLRVAHAGLALVAPTDAELLELAAIAAEPGGVVEPGREGELLLWPVLEEVGADAMARHVLEAGWRMRVHPTPASWRLPFAVLDGGRVVGHASLGLEHAQAGTVSTTSWLARADQGRGLGRRVRLMLLELGFAHLGAARAVTAAAVGNDAAIRVAQRCGYREVDRGRGTDGVEEVHFALTPAAWRRRRLRDVVVEGVEPFLAAITT
jgi:RimJ/RimL family protein N-acetyltransferase